MSFNFDNLDPAGRKAWYTIPTQPSIGRLRVTYAGRTNKGYTNDLAALTTKSGLAQKVAAGQVDADVLEANLQMDRDLFPLHVITAWEGPHDKNGKPLPGPRNVAGKYEKFSQASCAALLKALPTWLMNDLSQWAIRVSNFLPDLPTDADASLQAGE